IDISVDHVAGSFQLDGGTLRTFVNAGAKFTVDASLHVTSDSQIVTPLRSYPDITPPTHLAGMVTLADGVHLKKLGGGDLGIDAPLLVGEDTSIIAFDGDLNVNGALRSNAGQASIDFIGPGNLHLNG